MDKQNEFKCEICGTGKKTRQAYNRHVQFCQNRRKMIENDKQMGIRSMGRKFYCAHCEKIKETNKKKKVFNGYNRENMFVHITTQHSVETERFYIRQNVNRLQGVQKNTANNVGSNGHGREKKKRKLKRATGGSFSKSIDHVGSTSAHLCELTPNLCVEQDQPERTHHNDNIADNSKLDISKSGKHQRKYEMVIN
jgi:hypothetical protein